MTMSHEAPRDWRGPLVGAVLGAVIAFAAIAASVAVEAASRGSGDGIGLRHAFDLHGVAGGQVAGLAIAWLVGPVAAAIAGAALAGLAIRGVDGSGLWMGAVTYGGAIVLSPLAALPVSLTTRPTVDRILASAVQLVPIWATAAVALTPLFFVCLVAGPAWAATLRAVAPERPAPAQDPRSLPIWPLVCAAVLLSLGWLIFLSVLQVATEFGLGQD
jgi:hypothetical protein